jgi:hypothetical protein
MATNDEIAGAYAEYASRELASSIDENENDVVSHEDTNKRASFKNIGNLALLGASNGVILGHNLGILAKGSMALLAKDTHVLARKSGEKLSPILRRRYESKDSTSISTSRIKKIGNFLLKKSLVATEFITIHSSNKASELSRKTKRYTNDFIEKNGGGYLTDMAREYKSTAAENKKRKK